jgi:lysozyme
MNSPRLGAAAAVALLLAGGGALLALTQQAEGTGPVEMMTVAEASRRGVRTAFLKLVVDSEVAVTHAYPDPGHGWRVPTICYGHTRGVRRDDVATLAQCRQMLIEDYETLVLPEIARCVTAPVSVGEAAALADFFFNVGGQKACASTLVRHLNAGNRAAAAAEFPKWKYSNGKVMPGLVKRRAAERALFLGVASITQG